MKKPPTHFEGYHQVPGELESDHYSAEPELRISYNKCLKVRMSTLGCRQGIRVRSRHRFVNRRYWGGSLMLLPPLAHQIRPSGNGCGSAQGGEEIGVIYRVLSTASLWKLKTGKPISIVERVAGIQ